MRKFIASLAAGAALLLTVTPALAKVDRVPGPWKLKAPQEITFVCGGSNYVHTLGIVSNLPDGNFTGTGYYNPDRTYTWKMTGNISGDNINFQIVYTGTGAGTVYNGFGTIASDGSISGTVDNNCQTFTMGVGSAVVSFTGNHGQYVSSVEDKQEAAQSRIGMPVQSEGHTK
ncbi:MAG: hypothetical protein M1609_00640 [Firmicutes bacterium]|nr:hypothetical protein [Bacillota bacterium]